MRTHQDIRNKSLLQEINMMHIDMDTYAHKEKSQYIALCLLFLCSSKCIFVNYSYSEDNSNTVYKSLQDDKQKIVWMSRNLVEWNEEKR